MKALRCQTEMHVASMHLRPMSSLATKKCPPAFTNAPIVPGGRNIVSQTTSVGLTEPKKY